LGKNFALRPAAA
jgi:hypothetical protein